MPGDANEEEGDVEWDVPTQKGFLTSPDDPSVGGVADPENRVGERVPLPGHLSHLQLCPSGRHHSRGQI